MAVWSIFSFLLRTASWRRSTVRRRPASMGRGWASTGLPAAGRSHRMVTHKSRVGSWMVRVIAVHMFSAWTDGPRSRFASRRTWCFLLALCRHLGRRSITLRARRRRPRRKSRRPKVLCMSRLAGMACGTALCILPRHELRWRTTRVGRPTLPDYGQLQVGRCLTGHLSVSGMRGMASRGRRRCKLKQNTKIFVLHKIPLGHVHSLKGCRISCFLSLLPAPTTHVRRRPTSCTCAGVSTMRGIKYVLVIDWRTRFTLVGGQRGNADKI